MKPPKQASASYYADHTSSWDERYFLTTVNGYSLWESARHTSRGGSIRLMRLDNRTLKVYRAYVPLDTPMRLIEKDPESPLYTLHRLHIL